MHRFSDPDHELYRAFGLSDASLFELAHPRVWGRWLSTALGRGAGSQGPHWRQLTGVFLVDRDTILAEIRHSNSAARPDYLAFVQSGAEPSGYNIAESTAPSALRDGAPVMTSRTLALGLDAG